MNEKVETSEQPYIETIRLLAADAFGKLLKEISSRRSSDWNGEPTIQISVVLKDRPATSIKTLSKFAQQFERAVSDALDPQEPEAFFVFYYVTVAELKELEKLALDD